MEKTRGHKSRATVPLKPHTRPAWAVGQFKGLKILLLCSDGTAYVAECSTYSFLFQTHLSDVITFQRGPRMGANVCAVKDLPIWEPLRVPIRCRSDPAGSKVESGSTQQHLHAKTFMKANCYWWNLADLFQSYYSNVFHTAAAQTVASVQPGLVLTATHTSFNYIALLFACLFYCINCFDVPSGCLFVAILTLLYCSHLLSSKIDPCLVSNLIFVMDAR